MAGQKETPKPLVTESLPAALLARVGGGGVGYQRFWLPGPATDEPFNEPRRPALAEQLQALHAFSEELKSVLGVPSFYNESIGSTCEVTAYDRLKGRGPAPRTSLH